MKITYWAAAGLLLTSSLAWGIPRQTINGTFQKGPAIGGRDVERGATITITGEKATGSVLGGIFTGPADYYTIKEVINFATEEGEFKIDVTVHKANGSTIVIALEGVTEGVTETAVDVSVHGTWRIKDATGADFGLQGHGTFTGTEAFATGVTNGSFSGEVH
jgi:hypothetical protein